MKRISLILLSIVLLSCLFSCEKENKDGEIIADTAYVAYDMETFLADVYATNNTDDHRFEDELPFRGVKDPTRKLIAPDEIPDGYKLRSIESARGVYEYRYCSVEEPGNDRRDIFVRVRMKENTFEEQLEMYNLTPIDGVAYYEPFKMWMFEVDTVCVTIELPPHSTLENADEIVKCFTFKEIQISELEKYVK